jgi:hypothetical protein
MSHFNGLASVTALPSCPRRFVSRGSPPWPSANWICCSWITQTFRDTCWSKRGGKRPCSGANMKSTCGRWSAMRKRSGGPTLQRNALQTCRADALAGRSVRQSRAQRAHTQTSPATSLCKACGHTRSTTLALSGKHWRYSASSIASTWLACRKRSVRFRCWTA